MFKTRPNFDVTNQTKGSAVPVNANSVFVGSVVRSDATGVYVSVPNLAPNQIFGPCQVFGQKPKNGRSVIVGFTEGRRQKIVILGTENKNFKLVGVETPVDDEDAANKKYVDDKVADLLSKLISKAPGYVLNYAPPSP